MTDYRYIFGTLRSEQVIDEIPCFGVFMSMEMNAGGEFQGTFQLDQTGKDNATLLSATVPGHCWVAVERNGTCIWHGFIWSRTYSAQSKTIQMFAQTFDRYPEKRRMTNGDLSYVGVDQRNVFVDLWANMMAEAGSDINVILPSAFTTAVPIDLTILESDAKYYSDVMTSLANAETGFDWYIQPTKDGTLYRKTLLVGYPTLGTNPGPGMIVFEFPGNITQYYLTEAMASAGNNIFVNGAGEGSTQLLGIFSDDVAIANGAVRWDFDVNRKDIDTQVGVDGIAANEGAKRQPPMPIIKLQVKANLDPTFGSYNLGDTCGIAIRDPRFPGIGVFLRKRLLRWELTPQSSSASEEAALVFEGDPDV